MVNQIKNTTLYGIFILEDQGGWVASNLPGDADLDQLTEGTQYIFIEDVKRFTRPGNYKWQTNYLGDGKKRMWTHGDRDLLWQIEALVSEDNSGDDSGVELIEKFCNIYCKASFTQKYLVFRKSSTDYKQFPNAAGTLMNYCPVMIMTTQPTFLAEEKDWTLIIGCMEAWTS